MELNQIQVPKNRNLIAFKNKPTGFWKIPINLKIGEPTRKNIKINRLYIKFKAFSPKVGVG